MSLRPSTTTTHTSLPPACLQFAPTSPSHLIVGTYHLDPTATTATTKKTGSLLLYHHASSHPSSSSLTLLQTLPTPAVLDLKFSPHDPTLLAAATALGKILLFRLDSDTVGIESVGELRPAAAFDDTDDDTLVLSLAWSPTRAGEAAFTLSTGRVGVVDIATQNVRAMEPGHSLEAWTVEYATDGGRLFSGGDDGVLVWYDVREGVETGRNRKVHGAGVTAILARGGGVLTGSYDESLRSWEDRMGMMRVQEKELGLGGGVWRLKDMQDGKRVLASCMHAGARIVNLDADGGGRWEVVQRWEENESMNYGSHVHTENQGVVASCSFYDKLLSLWEV